MRRWWIGAALAAMAALWGCHAPPISVQLSYGNDGSVKVPTGIQWWPIESPQSRLPPGSRVALLECSVEFVTVRQVMPTDRQAMVSGPFTPAAAMLEFSGLLRQRVEYPRALSNGIPNAVYDAVVRHLEKCGLEVVDCRGLISSGGGGLEGVSMVSSSPAKHIDPVGSDTGRISAFELHSADRLMVLPARMTLEQTASEREVLDSLDADLVLRLQLRIGVYHGMAAVEQGSRIFLTTESEATRLISQRSLVADHQVSVQSGYQPVLGKRAVVDWMTFRESVIRMAAAYLDPALPRSATTSFGSQVASMPSGPLDARAY